MVRMGDGDQRIGAFAVVLAKQPGDAVFADHGVVVRSGAVANRRRERATVAANE
jgi:hypothetical protein